MKCVVCGSACIHDAPKTHDIRIAITKDGKLEVWDKDEGVHISVLDYREPEYPKITEYTADTQIGPQGDY